MYISKIRVKDYKSFRDSGVIEFKAGINIIVGQNNVGKTTLLEGLEISIKDIPHRSLKTSKNKIYTDKDTDNSTLYVSLTLGEQDIPSLQNYTKKRHKSGVEYDALYVPFSSEDISIITYNEGYISIRDHKEEPEIRKRNLDEF